MLDHVTEHQSPDDSPEEPTTRREEAAHSLAGDGGLPPEPPQTAADTRSLDTLHMHEGVPRSGENSLTMHRMVAHDRLAHQSRIVLRLGQMLLAAGASAFRVKYSMAKLAQAVGIEQHHAQVTYSEIIATAYANGTFRTELAEQRAMGVNADRIDLLTNYIDSIDGRQVLVEEVDSALDDIEKVGPLYGWFGNALASGVACAGFSFLNHGGVVECSVVAVAAFVGQWLRRQMLHRRMNHFGVWMACGAVAATIYILMVGAAQHFWGLEPTHQAGFISALLFLVPGFPLVTGIIDLVRQDFLAGMARLTYVTMLVVSAAVAVWTVSLIFDWSVTPAYDYHLHPVLLYTLRAVASLVASYGFAMLFNSPPKVCAAAAAIGAIINVGRLTLVDVGGMPVQAAVGLAALCAGLLATVVARRTNYSRVTLSVPAVVIMIPGVPLYRALAYLNDGKTTDALASIFTVLFTIIAIGVGLAVARMVTDRNWLMERPRGVPSLGEYAQGE